MWVPHGTLGFCLEQLVSFPEMGKTEKSWVKSKLAFEMHQSVPGDRGDFEFFSLYSDDIWKLSR